MKKNFHKTIAICLAFVVLASTMSFTISMHYCGDTLVETAIFHKANGCGMEMEKPTAKDCAIVKKNCCNDQQLIVEGQDELQIHKISFEQEVFIVNFIDTYNNLFESLENNTTTHEVYKPPIVIRQLYKIDETYLI